MLNKIFIEVFLCNVKIQDKTISAELNKLPRYFMNFFIIFNTYNGIFMIFKKFLII